MPLLTDSQIHVEFITGYILQPNKAIMAGKHGYPGILVR